jgi:hypothetical protein
MALGPKTNKADRLKKLEQVIDAAIKRSDENSITFNVENLPCFSSEIWSTLRKRYKSAGWKKVEFVSDQRDGDYISLEA